ncbi:hypothetical protein [Primorskyibacter sedentarius]|uniref:hypothetical protein n=1 Tax=Primorskyibacter sedentarius TaxID=745311 RepID=UPI003EBDC09F
MGALRSSDFIENAPSPKKSYDTPPFFGPDGPPSLLPCVNRRGESQQFSRSSRGVLGVSLWVTQHLVSLCAALQRFRPGESPVVNAGTAEIRAHAEIVVEQLSVNKQKNRKTEKRCGFFKKLLAGIVN